MTDVSAFDVGAAAAPSDKLEILKVMLEEAITLRAVVEQMEEDLKAVNKTLHALAATRIPDCMAELQMDEIKFRGWKVKLQDFVSGSLPKDPEAKARAISWLDAQGAGGLIKTNIAMAFGRSQHNEALDLAARLQEQGYTVDVQSGVHSQTLCAFARERIKSGEELDIEALGLYTGKVAKMERVK